MLIGLFHPGYEPHLTKTLDGVIFVPYAPSVMQFFENYAMGMPIFVPSLKFIQTSVHPFPEFAQYKNVNWCEKIYALDSYRYNY
jgi:hypothetical protein